MTKVWLHVMASLSLHAEEGRGQRFENIATAIIAILGVYSTNKGGGTGSISQVQTKGIFQSFSSLSSGAIVKPAYCGDCIR